MALTATHYLATNLTFTKANVMIDENGRARLADFGLLTFVSDPSNPSNPSSVINAGTTRWMSPELLHPEHFGFKQSRPTKKSDCYALGMVILEVLSGEPPFARDKDFIVMRKVIEGERPERPKGAWFTDGLWRTLEQCWLPQPHNRPTIEAVLGRLGHVLDNWQPFLPFADDVETDGGESVSATSQGKSLYLPPKNLFVTTGKDIPEFIPGPPGGWQQLFQQGGTSRTKQEKDPVVIKFQKERKRDAWEKTGGKGILFALSAQRRPAPGPPPLQRPTQSISITESDSIVTQPIAPSPSRNSPLKRPRTSWEACSPTVETHYVPRSNAPKDSWSEFLRIQKIWPER
jgi:serine/threonine protein kinase